MLDRRHREKETQQVWDKQIRGKQLLKEEMSRVAQEDKLEMEKLGEQLRREEIAGDALLNEFSNGVHQTAKKELCSLLHSYQ